MRMNADEERVRKNGGRRNEGGWTGEDREEGMGRRKGWGGGRDGEEDGIGRKRRDGNRVDGIREDGMVMTG